MDGVMRIRVDHALPNSALQGTLRDKAAPRP